MRTVLDYLPPERPAVILYRWARKILMAVVIVGIVAACFYAARNIVWWHYTAWRLCHAATVDDAVVADWATSPRTTSVDLSGLTKAWPKRAIIAMQARGINNGDVVNEDDARIFAAACAGGVARDAGAAAEGLESWKSVGSEASFWRKYGPDWVRAFDGLVGSAKSIEEKRTVVGWYARLTGRPAAFENPKYLTTASPAQIDDELDWIHRRAADAIAEYSRPP